MKAKNQLLDRISGMQSQVTGIQKDIDWLRVEVKQLFDAEEQARISKKEQRLRDLEEEYGGHFFVPAEDHPVPAPPVAPGIIGPDKSPIEKPKPQAARRPPQKPRPKLDETIGSAAKAQQHKKQATVALPPAPPTTPPPPPKAGGASPLFPKFKGDLERFIGENLISKIGIAILVTGIGFFVKYAIDQNWIGEVGRMLIGLLCGGILLGFAHKTRKKYKAFSSVLVAGGIATFYFSIGIGYQLYGLMTQPVAFGIMAGVTALSVLLSLSYNRQELAVLSLIGGFATPLIVSNGSGNYVVLFTYLLILNAGMLAVAALKRWQAVRIVSFAATSLFFGSWLTMDVISEPNAPYFGALAFATGFFVLFFNAGILNNIREQRKFARLDFGLLLANTGLFYGAGMLILGEVSDGMWRGIFTALTAGFHLLYVLPLLRYKKIDSNIIYLLTGLTLTFVTLTAPVQLEGNHITLFWAVEAVMLLWLSQKSNISLMRLGAVALLPLMLTSLLMDYQDIYTTSNIGRFYPMLNQGFITTFVAVGLLAVWSILAKRYKAELYGFSLADLGRIAGMATLALGFWGGFLELRHQLLGADILRAFRVVVLSTYMLAFLAGTMAWAERRGSFLLRQALFVAGLVSATGYVLINYEIGLIRKGVLLDATASVGQFVFHYICLALVAYALIYSFRFARKVYGMRSEGGILTVVVACLAILYVASAELDHYVALLGYRPGFDHAWLMRQSHKIGYPIVWGICSFGLLFAGMKKSYKPLRIIALGLFTLTLFKLFLFDIHGASEGGKIAAFICLGILLLVVSFLYQKLKTLVFGDDPQVEA